MPMIGSEVPSEMQDRVERELERGERILWMEQPIPRFFSTGGIAASIFGLLWTAGMMFAFYDSNFGDGSEKFIFSSLFLIPFFLVGLGLFSTPLWVYRAMRNTVYTITDRRAISIEVGIRSTTIRSYPPDRLQDLYRIKRRNGVGDVVIINREWKDSDNNRQIEKLGFMNVRDAKSVETMLRELVKTSLRTSMPQE